ncbi:MAG: SIS domain-containing protein [Spirochaetales bacterium]|nr:SIS domain-containing protein [Spirochaetales bacterium]
MENTRTQHPFWIYETITSCGEVLASWQQDRQQGRIEEVAEVLVERKPTHVFLAGTGSSHLATLAQSHALHRIAAIPCSTWVAAELRSYPPPHFDGSAALMLNTHSGKSPGDASLIEAAKERGVYTIGVTDVEDSATARACHSLLIGQDGAKREMPSTRSYSSAIYRTLLLAVACAQESGSTGAAAEYLPVLRKLPGIMTEFVKGFAARAKSLVAEFVDVTAYSVVSAGPNLSTAHEAAMGLTQGTGRPAAGYEVEEYMHGPVQSLAEGQCLVAIAAPGPFQEKIAEFAKAARRIGAKVLMVAPEASGALEAGDVGIGMPKGIPEILTPVLYCAPFWLLGYYFSLHFGLNPDTLSMETEAFKKSGLAELKKLV